MGFGQRKRKRSNGGRARKKGRFDVKRRRALLGEIKFHDLDIDDAVIAANGTIAEDSVLTIAEGNGECDRVGRKVTVVKVLWRYRIEMTNQIGANPAASDEVRVVLYWDKQANGATAAVTDILKTDDFQSFRELANTGRFTILHDRVFNLRFRAAAGDGSVANDWGGEGIHHIMSKNVNIPIQYDDSATTGALTSMRSNNIGVLLLSKAGVTSFESKMRIRFSDV